MSALFRFGRPFRGHLAWGLFGTVLVVLSRLAMPWPLRWIIEHVFPAGEASSVMTALSGWGDPVLLLAIGFLVLAIGVGLSEFLQRVSLKKYAAHTVHAMRTEAVRGAASSGAPTGDTIARVIGDAARAKANFSGILVHFSQNVLLFAGICIVFLFVHWELAAFFLIGGLVSIWIGARTAGPVATVSEKHRRKEGAYADSISSGIITDVISRNSLKKEVEATKLIALSSVLGHSVLGLMTGAALWLGTVQVQAGELAPGVLILFVAYALTAHRRLVHIGRQIARSGKLTASVDRLTALVREEQPAVPVRPLTRELRLDSVLLRTGTNGSGRSRIRQMDLVIRAGSRVAVLGKPGAGTTSLLSLLAGTVRPTEGKIVWDEEPMGNGVLRSRVGYLPEDPRFPRMTTWELLGLEGPELREAQEKTLHDIGALRIIQRSTKELEAKVSSSTMSRGEARALTLAAVLLSDEPVCVLDDAVEGMGSTSSERRLKEILERTSGRTLIVGLSRPILIDQFDRVLELSRGKVRFDGTPQEWKTRKEK